MCHSVEMYLPKVTRQHAEHALGAADLAAAERERAVADAGLGLIARVRRWFGRRPLAEATVPEMAAPEKAHG